MKLDDLIIAADTPPSAYSHHVDRLAAGLVLVRPWIPGGVTPGGIIWQRRSTNPPVWGWLLAACRTDVAANPELRPGCMVIFRRFSGEHVGNDIPLAPTPDEVGMRYNVWCIPVASLDAAIDPPNVPLTW